MNASIYHYFTGMKATTIRELASEEVAKLGLRHYEKQDFYSYEWLKSGVHLKAMVDRKRVELAWKDGSLIGGCSCSGRMPAHPCRHLIGAMFTLCNLVDDEQLRVLSRNNIQHERLKTWFFNAFPDELVAPPVATQPELNLVLRQNGGLDLVEKVVAPAQIELGLAVAPVVADADRHTLDAVEARVADSGASIKFATPQTVEEQLTWSGALSGMPILHLDAQSDRRFICMARLQDDASTDWVFPHPMLALDTTTRALYRREPSAAVDLHHEVDKILAKTSRDPSGYSVAISPEAPLEFSGPDWATASAQMQFFEQGKAVELTPLVPQIGVDLVSRKLGKKKVYQVKFDIRVDGEALPALEELYHAVVMDLIAPRIKHLQDAKCIEDMLHAVDASFMISNRKKAAAAQSRLLKKKSGLGHPSVIERVKSQLALIDTCYVRPTIFYTYLHEGHWRVIESPLKPLMQAGAIMRQLVAADTMLSGADLVLRCEFTKLQANLARVLSGLTDLGMPCLVDGQPVRRVKLDVQLDATSSEDIDWFTLHPTIRLENRSLKGEEWLEIVRSGGAFPEGDSLAVVAGEDLDLLELLQKLMGDKKADGDSAEVSRLEVFHWIELHKKQVKFTLPKEAQSTLDALFSFETLPSVAKPEGLQAEMRPYQHAGYEWLAFLYNHRFGACLADDMGLGKTLQTIALMAALHEGVIKRPFKKKRAHLVVMPASLIFNWSSEIKRFFPALKTYEYIGIGRNEGFKGADVVLTTYGTLQRSIDKLKKVKFDLVILDEAQAIKNRDSARAKMVYELDGAFRLCLTGTPLENHIGEFYSIMDFALPGLLGDYGQFMRSDTALEQAVGRTRPFLLRRNKREILDELPDKIEQELYLDLSPMQRECYTRTIEEVRDDIDLAYADRDAGKASITALTALLRLRQLCVSPQINHPEIEEPAPKLEFLVNQLTELQEEGHASLVFSSFVHSLDLIEAALTEAGIATLRLDGKTSAKKRKANVEHFQSGEGPAVFLISLKAGGVGLNLTRAGYVFHVDPWWNPAVENQATDRAHRMGQKQTVMVTRLIMRNTIEEKMMVLKEQKKAVFDAVLEGAEARDVKAGLTREDFEFLLGG
ncbi:MAG: superfamily II DNA or RNA helicase [Candidatus Omnitrophota bacterium]|jgi:superfamily II DNA or RNA helicase